MPTMVEQASVTFKVDSASQSATASLMVSVAEPDGGITIVTRSLLPGQVGASYPPADAALPQEMQQHIRVLGAQGAVTFTVDGNLPAGLQLDNDGYLHGIPVQAGVFDVKVIASDDVGETRRTLPLTIGNPGRLTLVASTLPEGRLRQNYNYELRVIGRSQTATVTFNADGPVPPGISVSLAGLVIGVPQQVGTWIFSVTASEGTGPGAVQDSATFRFVVTQDEGFEIVETSLPFATIGEEYEADVGSRNGEPQLTWRVMGPTLPAGLSFEIIMDDQGEQKLRFRGTPEAAETVSILATVRDGAGRYAQQPLTIEVRAPVVIVPPVVMDSDGCTCTAPSASQGWSTLGLLMVAGVLLTRRRRN
jgi:MYXO-CTERM domain-containing protein